MYSISHYRYQMIYFFSVSCVSVVPLLCHFIAECGHDEGGIVVGREVSLTESFSVLNVILVADPITVLTAMEKGNIQPFNSKICLLFLPSSCYMFPYKAVTRL